LESEIKADEKGKWEFDLVIGQLETRKKVRKEGGWRLDGQNEVKQLAVTGYKKIPPNTPL